MIMEENRTTIPTTPLHKKSGDGESKAVSILKGVGYFALYFGAQIVVSIVAELIILALYISKGGDLDTGAMTKAVTDAINSNAMLITIIFDLIFAAVLALFIIFTKSSPAKEENRAMFRKISPKKAIMAFFIGVTGNFALNIVMTYAQMFFPKIFEQYDSATEIYTLGGLVPYIIGGVILAPIIEELTFRGFMQTRFSRAMPKSAAVIAVGVIFGAVHGNLVQAIYAAVLGILLGEIFVHSGSIYASILCHFGFNLSSLPGYIASVEGSTLADNATFNLAYGLVSYLCVFILVPLLTFYFQKNSRVEKTNI